ncbi:MAG: UDP-3-O-(3-hydroxymyristoyl)glucosamine N-acyltransferase, partial [Elusimicrobiota bacterium]|nr:UDP-3-O-(3-hydroxymyristoyl)glucosamine N-acyltransferase [Elusimicrobiota bacterium]
EIGIHQTAIISKSAKLGENVTIGPYTIIEADVSVGENTVISANCYIGRNSTIGKKCFIYPQVVIRENVTIGNEVIIHSGTVIGSDGFGYFKMQENTHMLTHIKIPQIGTVEIEDNVEIGACVTIDRATTGKTVIGSGTKIDNLVQIGHNVKIGKNCIIVSQAGIAGSVKIGNNVTIAGQAGIKDHIIIGDGAVVAAQSGVIGDVKHGEIVSGYPARPHKEALKVQAFINKLALTFFSREKKDKQRKAVTEEIENSPGRN